MIERKEYLEKLNDWKDKNIIKVITGIRRCGKSTLLRMFANELLHNEVKKEQIISINFEKMEVENLLDYKKLYNYIIEKSIYGKMMYLFLDKIQNVPFYEKVVDSLFVKKILIFT